MQKKGEQPKHLVGLKRSQGNPKARKAYANEGTDLLKHRLKAIAFKPLLKTWEALAKELDISIVTLIDTRKKYATEIEELHRDHFTDARAAVEEALIQRATGITVNRKFIDRAGQERESESYFPPDTAAINLYLGRYGQIKPIVADESFDLFADGQFPHIKQVGPLLHWDRAWGDNGHDQIIFCVTGSGFGKSWMLARKALLLARMNRGMQGLLSAPTYAMLNDPLQRYFEEAMRIRKIPFQWSGMDKQYLLWGDTVIHARSFDDPNKIRGLDLAWVCADEIREAEHEVHDVFVGRVRAPLARLRQIVYTTTPAGFSWHHDLFVSPESPLVKSGRVKMYCGTSMDNPVLPKSFDEAMKDSYDEQVYRQEALGEFVVLSSRNIYYAFNRQKHVGKYPIDKSKPIHIGIDFNWNPLCAVIGQEHGTNGKTVVHIVDEVRIAGASTDDLCKELKRRGYDPKSHSSEWVSVYPDASGNQKGSAQGARSNFAILREYGFDNLLHSPSNARLRDQYNAVNGMFCNARGEQRLFIDGEHCPFLIRDLERDVFKEGSHLREENKDGAKERGHLVAGLRYFIHYRYRLESPYSSEFRFA